MTDRTTHDPTMGSTGTSSSGFSGAAAGSGAQTGDERERARQAADEIKGAAKDAASSTATAVRNRLTGELDYRKYRSRQRLNRVAEALRQTGTRVNPEDDAIGRYMERAAQKVEHISEYLDRKNVDEILSDAREMARRRPEVFAGGLFLAGVMLGRFLRSSGAGQRYDEETWDDYPSYAGAGNSSPYEGSTNPYASGGRYSGTGAGSSPEGGGRMP